MKGKKQIERSTVIQAPAAAVWEVLADSRLLPAWAPVVNEVTECSADGEAVGELRHCRVNLAGKSGRMVERCIEFSPTTRIAYVVDDESFGMRKMFDHYGFAINVESQDAEKARVTLETHYSPRNPMYGLLNKLMLRRQFEKVCTDILGGLKTFTESRYRTNHPSPVTFSATPAQARRR
jgi:uncharacterized protein YndB with AHSA1/START domain